MTRAFACLALSAMMLLVGTAVAGFLQPGGTSERHILLAVLTLIFLCFVQVATFTYFTVTGKMIGQMVHLARLDPSYLNRVQVYKRTMTRLLGLLVGGIVPVAATGGALWRQGSGSVGHLAAGALLLFLFVFVAYRQINVIVMNASLFREVTEAYNARPRRDVPVSLSRSGIPNGESKAIRDAVTGTLNVGRVSEKAFQTRFEPL